MDHDELLQECDRLRERVRELERERNPMSGEGVDFRLTLAAGGVGAWQWDAATNIASWTDENFRVLGLKPGSVQPAYDVWFSRLHVDDRDEASRQVQLAMEGEGRLDISFRVVDDDGRIRWINDVGSMLRRPDGTAVGMYGIQRDVTAQVESRQQLDELHGLLQAIMESTPDWIFAKDTDHRFLFVNRAFAAAQNRTPSEMIGHLDTDFWSLEQCEGDPATGIRGFHHDDRDAFGGRVIRNPLDQATVGTGDTRCFDTIKTPLRSLDGRVIGVLCYSRDITERVLAEQAMREVEAQLRQSLKMEAVGTLAGGIAHDFNNVLAVIISHAELLSLDLPAADSRREDVVAILAAGRRAAGLVRQILDFSRARAVVREPVAVQPLVREALKFLRSTLPTSIEFQVELPEDELVVVGNETQLHQVLLNLATNAAHAMRADGGILRVVGETVVIADGRAGLPDGRYARLVVADSGHGISSDILPRIFDPFFTTKAPGEGSGLGLAAVHGILKSHEGGVTVESTEGQGAEFSLYLPLVSMSPVPAQTPDARVTVGAGRRVLLVDDEPMVSRSIERTLRRMNFNVTVCDGAAAALAAAVGSDPGYDLLLSDLTMPGLGGVELARRMRSHLPSLPVILMTGNVDALDPAVLSEASLAAVMAKPFSSAELGQTIERVLSRAKT
jgi:PAS domain S-box-containing protein